MDKLKDSPIDLLAEEFTDNFCYSGSEKAEEIRKAIDRQIQAEEQFKNGQITAIQFIDTYNEEQAILQSSFIKLSYKRGLLDGFKLAQFFLKKGC